MSVSSNNSFLADLSVYQEALTNGASDEQAIELALHSAASQRTPSSPWDDAQEVARDLSDNFLLNPGIVANYAQLSGFDLDLNLAASQCTFTSPLDDDKDFPESIADGLTEEPTINPNDLNVFPQDFSFNPLHHCLTPPPDINIQLPDNTLQDSDTNRPLPDTYAGRRGNKAREAFPWECGVCHKRFLYKQSAEKHHSQSHGEPVVVLERWPNAPSKPPPSHGKRYTKRKPRVVAAKPAAKPASTKSSNMPPTAPVKTKRSAPRKRATMANQRSLPAVPPVTPILPPRRRNLSPASAAQDTMDRLRRTGPYSSPTPVGFQDDEDPQDQEERDHFRQSPDTFDQRQDTQVLSLAEQQSQYQAPYYNQTIQPQPRYRPTIDPRLDNSYAPFETVNPSALRGPDPYYYPQYQQQTRNHFDDFLPPPSAFQSFNDDMDPRRLNTQGYPSYNDYQPQNSNQIHTYHHAHPDPASHYLDPQENFTQLNTYNTTRSYTPAPDTITPRRPLRPRSTRQTTPQPRPQSHPQSQPPPSTTSPPFDFQISVASPHHLIEAIPPRDPNRVLPVAATIESLRDQVERGEIPDLPPDGTYSEQDQSLTWHPEFARWYRRIKSGPEMGLWEFWDGLEGIWKLSVP